LLNVYRLLLILCFFFVQEAESAQDYAEIRSKADFLALYRPIAERYASYVPMSLVVELSETKIKDGVKSESQRTFHVIRDRDRLRVDSLPKQGKEVCRVAAPKRSFRVARGVGDEQYLVEDLSSDYQDAVRACRLVAPVVDPYYSVLELPLHEFLSRGDIEFKGSTVRVNEAGEEEVEITVGRNVIHSSGKKDEWIYSFSLLPKHDWILSNYHLVNAEYEVRFHYDFSRNTPVISRVIATDKGPDGYSYDATYEVTEVSLEPPKEQVFTLADFRLNNDIGRAQKRPYASWLIGINIVVIVILVAILIRKRFLTKP
jgi:hypothetical protein